MDSAYDDELQPQFAPGTNERDITPEELAALKQKQTVGAAPSDGAPPSPGFALQGRLAGGKMYDPSGREISSIGDSPEQAAEQFGRTLPMNQREVQRLSQLEQGYNDLLRNPNIDPRAKHNMLHDMARQIQYGHWRMQYQLSQDRMQQRASRQQLLEEQIQGRHQVSANEAGLMTGDAQHFAGQVADLQKKFPDHDVEYSSKAGITIKPKGAKGKPEKEPDAVQGILSEQKAVKSLEPSFAAQPAEVQKAFKEKYGDGAAAHGWALERLGEKKKEAAAAKSAAAAQSGASRSTPGAAAPSGAAPTSLDQRLEMQKQLGTAHQRDLATLEKIERPEERAAKQGALTKANQLLMMYAGKPVPDHVRAELQRLKTVITQKWPAEPAPVDRSRDATNANRFAGGT